MPVYIEYDLGDGATILVEAPEDEIGGIVRASRNPGEVVKTAAKKSFADALKDVKTQSNLLIKEVEDLPVTEAQIKFGINTVGELGNLAIGKLGVGVNYEVTLIWKKPEPKK